MDRDEMLRAARLVYWWATANAFRKISIDDLTYILSMPKAQVLQVMPAASLLVPGLEWIGNGVEVPRAKKQKPKPKLKLVDSPMGKADFTRPTKARPKGEVRGIYLHWLKATGRSAQTTKLTSGRATAIRARLADGYTPEQLRRAIDGNRASEWHQGGNPDGKRWDDLTLILRNGEKVEWFSELAGGGRKPPTVKAKGSAQTSTYNLDDIAIGEVIYGDNPLAAVVKVLRRADLGKWLQPAADKFEISADRLREMVSGGGLLL